MFAGETSGEKDTLKSVQEQFEQWRRERKQLGPIPAELWEAAAALTERHTHLEVSKALRLNYNDLKKRAQAWQEQRLREDPSESGFVEVDLGGMGNGGGGFVLEWEGVCGDKLRIEVQGKSEVDVARVVAALGALGR